MDIVRLGYEPLTSHAAQRAVIGRMRSKESPDHGSPVHLRFPFHAPGYVIEMVQARGTSFDVVHCRCDF